MRLLTYFPAVLLLLMIIVAPPSFAQGAVNFANLPQVSTVVPNLGVVSPTLLRGAHPKKGGLKALRDAGVRTVISLRGGDDKTEKEGREAKALGMKFVSIPMSHFKVPRQKDVDKFLSIVQNEAMQPVFVHCARGEDRTGAMVAIYRMETSNWTVSQSYDEMLKYGFHPFFIRLTDGVYRQADKLGRAEARTDSTEIVQYFKDRTGVLSALFR